LYVPILLCFPKQLIEPSPYSLGASVTNLKEKSAQRDANTARWLYKDGAKNFRHAADPLSGGAGRPKFNQLEMVTTFIYRPSLVKRGKGICGGAKIFGFALLQPARSVCVSLSAFFILISEMKEALGAIIKAGKKKQKTKKK